MPDQTPNVYYELWENRSGNLLAEFDTEDEALRFVCESVSAGDGAAILSWSLHQSDRAAPLAYGQELVDLANRRAAV